MPNQGLEFASDRRSLEGFPYHNSKAIGNRSRATEEKAGSAPVESKGSGGNFASADLFQAVFGAALLKTMVCIKTCDQMKGSNYRASSLPNTKALAPPVTTRAELSGLHQNLPERYSPISRTCIMKPKDFLRSVILIVALSAFGISSVVASDKK